MSIAKRLVLPSVTVLLAATFAVSGCAPSIDPAAKADLDRRVAALAGSGQSYAAPEAVVPLPLALGQWTQHKMTDDKGQPSFMTYKVVGQEGDAFWMETTTETYTGKTGMKMLLAIGDRMDPNSVDIRAVLVKDNKGQVTKFDGPVLQLTRSLYQNAASTLIVTWRGMPQEDVVVPAGRFTSCFKTRTDAAWGPWKAVSDAWSHPSVPLSGLVRSQGVGKPTTMELTGFGLTGAVSDF